MTSQPHDHLVRGAFDDKETAVSLFRRLLAPSLAEHLDFSDAERLPERFVDPDLTTGESDVLYRVKLKDREAFVYLLLEHQSSVDKMMPWRLLRYMVRIWERWLENNQDAAKLPPIFPMVLYQGGREWKAATRFIDLIDAPDDLLHILEPFVPKFEFKLHDLGKLSDDQLMQLELTAFAQLVMLHLKHIHAPDLGEKLHSWIDSYLELLGDESGLRSLNMLLNYVYQASDAVTVEGVQEFARRLGPSAQEVAMTLAQRISEEGRREGRQEAKEKQCSRMLRQISLRFGELPDQVVQRVNQATDEDLDRWTEQILTASSLADIFPE